MNQFRSVFAEYGVLNTVMSDNGPPYAYQKFKDLSSLQKFYYVTSPRYPQSNGFLEMMSSLYAEVNEFRTSYGSSDISVQTNPT